MTGRRLPRATRDQARTASADFSLSQLHSFPFDEINSDRSFVSEAVVSTYHRVLIEATIRVAKTLGMSTVAEGIETEDQATLLRELGCEKGQGYLFCKPLGIVELAHWLGSREQRHAA